MARLKDKRTGSIVNVDDDLAARLDGYEPAELGGYSTMKVDALKAEIQRRNEGRDEADLLSTEGKKADLVAALEADDE